MKYNIYDNQLKEYYLTDITLDEAKDTMIRLLEQWIDEEDDEDYRIRDEQYLVEAKKADTAKEINDYLEMFGYVLEASAKDLQCVK